MQSGFAKLFVSIHQNILILNVGQTIPFDYYFFNEKHVLIILAHLTKSQVNMTWPACPSSDVTVVVIVCEHLRNCTEASYSCDKNKVLTFSFQVVLSL